LRVGRRSRTGTNGLPNVPRNSKNSSESALHSPRALMWRAYHDRIMPASCALCSWEAAGLTHG
jgi:hypothetical protein